MLPYWRLSAYYFFYFAFLGAFSPYFSLYLKSLGLSAWDIGVLMSLMQVMRVLAPPLWGALADRLGVRMPVVRAAGALAALGFAGFLLTRSFAGLFAVMAVMAFFWAASLPLVEAATLGHLKGAPGRYGRIRLWGSIGFIVTVLGCGSLLDRLPVSALVVIGLAIQVAVFGFSLLVPDAPPPAHESDHLPIWQVLRQKEVLRLLTACFFMAAAHAALYIFYSIYLVEHGYSKSAVGWLWSLGVIVEIGVFVWMPRLLAAYTPRGILAFAMACAVLRFLMIGWGVAWLPVIVAAQALHGATFGANHAAAMAAINRLFPGRHQGRGQALYASVTFGAGGMLGGLVAGWAWDALGGAAVWTLSAGFALVGMVLMLGNDQGSRAG